MNLASIVYSGKRCEVGGQVVYVTIDNYDPHPIQHCEMHSPTGMNWGYWGSGAADCAYSSLIDFLTRTTAPYCDSVEVREAARRLHQPFKFEFVGKFGKQWELDGATIAAWVAKVKAEAHV